LPVQKSGKLNLIDSNCELIPGLELRIFNGHTPGMIVPIISYQGRKIAYVTDLTPLTANIPLKWISAYDLYPVTAMEENFRSFAKLTKISTFYFLNTIRKHAVQAFAGMKKKVPSSKEKETCNLYLIN
jgi:hypothetical protein